MTTTTHISNDNPHPTTRKLYQQTPLIRSLPLSTLVGKPVYVKLDALQASGSFKDRGMAHLCTTYYQRGVTQLISSSGGNAGLAVATMAQQLSHPANNNNNSNNNNNNNLQVHGVVPQTTKPMVIDKLHTLGATVTITGENWNAADAVARQMVADRQGQAEYVSPYDNPLLWTGHATLVTEIFDQLVQEQQEQQSSDHEPTMKAWKHPLLGALIVSVGGGGLLCGVLEGLQNASTSSTSSSSSISTKVIAAETQGASSFGQAWAAGHVVTIPSIDSIATSLGATSVTPVALERAKQHVGGVESAICTDAEAIQACLQFANDHRLLVEPACGAALAVAYTPRLRDTYLQHIDGAIVIEVCGGSGVNVDLLYQWKQQFGL